MAKKESDGNSPQRSSGGSSGLTVFFVGFLTGVAMAALCGWYFYIGRHNPSVRHAQDTTAGMIRQTTSSLEAKLEAWHLTSTDIEQEVSKTGKIVRKQVREFGSNVIDAAGDATITGKIKAKYQLDRDLRGAGIVISTTDGRVTLSGNVLSAMLIGRAVGLAYDTDGVREVSSTLKVKLPNG